MSWAMLPERTVPSERSRERGGTVSENRPRHRQKNALLRKRGRRTTVRVFLKPCIGDEVIENRHLGDTKLTYRRVRIGHSLIERYSDILSE